MNEFAGYETSFAGFVDYKLCYPEKEVLWVISGYLIFLGTLISMIPQTISIVKSRSNYGLNSFMVFMNNLCSMLVCTNVLALHTSQFTGVLQYGFLGALPTLTTFFNFFLLFFGYIPVVFLSITFFDKKPRAKRDEKAIAFEHKSVIILDILLITIYIIIFTIYTCFGEKEGFSSPLNTKLGKAIGIICSILNVGLWLPQIITTIKLRDNGSLSLVYLGIQAPGGLFSTAFMIFGQGEHWTTWLPIFASCCQQILLLTLCIIFKCCNKKKSIGEGGSIISEEPMLKDKAAQESVV